MMCSTWRQLYTKAFTGTSAIKTTRIAKTPEIRPSMNVSALKMLATLSLEAPMARRMPISFLRSKTEM